MVLIKLNMKLKIYLNQKILIDGYLFIHKNAT